MTKLKHNKKRNTALLYEVLIRELTKAILGDDGSKREKITILLKEHFNKSTTLFKELELYKSLLESNNLDVYVAEKLIFESKREYSLFNKKKIFNEHFVLTLTCFSPYKLCSELFFQLYHILWISL